MWGRGLYLFSSKKIANWASILYQVKYPFSHWTEKSLWLKMESTGYLNLFLDTLFCFSGVFSIHLPIPQCFDFSNLSKFEYFLGQLSAYYSPFKIFLGRGALSTLKQWYKLIKKHFLVYPKFWTFFQFIILKTSAG